MPTTPSFLRCTSFFERFVSASGTFTYTYETNGSYSDNSGYDTTWCKRTVIQMPDSSYLTQYFDELGQGLSTVVTIDENLDVSSEVGAAHQEHHGLAAGRPRRG